jgi:hypothetical protein
MYAVTKGTDSVSLDTAHHQVVHAAKEAGLQVITLPGDGDRILLSLQWGLYYCKRYNWLTELIVPLDLFYDSNGENPLFALQYPLQARNNVKRLETRCLSFGIVSGKEEHCLIFSDL